MHSDSPLYLATFGSLMQSGSHAQHDAAPVILPPR
jgi:hypothetical protein